MTEEGGGKKPSRRKEVANLEARLALRKAMRATVQSLMILAKARGWSDNFMRSMHTDLLKGCNDAQSGDRRLSLILSAKIEIRPEFQNGWAIFIGVDKRYFKPGADPHLMFHAEHILRLHGGMKYVGIVKTLAPAFDALAPLGARLRFAETLQTAVMEYIGNPDNLQPMPIVAAAATDAPMPLGEVDALLRLRDPRIAGAHEKKSATPVRKLWANLEIDAFRERKEELEFLDRFLHLRERRVAWTVVSGDSGEGKTRLALEFFRRFSPHSTHFGFLDKEDYVRLPSWHPQRPTLIVVDYASRVVKQAATLLHDLIDANYRSRFKFDVRVLLLERNTSDEWYQELISPGTRNNSIVDHFYCEPKSAKSYGLSPLSLEALVQIARERLGGAELPVETWIEAICSIDPRQVEEDAGKVTRPRPLFAAAIGQALAEYVTKGGDFRTIGDLLQREKMLDLIIQRERRQVWQDIQAADRLVEKQRLRKHENLLIIATIALEFNRADLRKLPPEALLLLPDPTELDEDRYERMTGTRPVSVFKRLEPDILGEYFVLSALTADRNPMERQTLIDAALTMAGDSEFLTFIQNSSSDFISLLQKLDDLAPSPSVPNLIALKYFVGKTLLAGKRLIAEIERRNEENADSRAVKLSEEDYKERYFKMRNYEGVLSVAIFEQGLAISALDDSERATEAARLALRSCESITRKVASELDHPFNRQYLDRAMVCMGTVHYDALRFKESLSCMNWFLIQSRSSVAKNTKALRLVAMYYKMASLCQLGIKPLEMQRVVHKMIHYVQEKDTRSEVSAILADAGDVLTGALHFGLACDIFFAIGNSNRAYELLAFQNGAPPPRLRDPSEGEIRKSLLARILREPDEEVF